MKKQLKSKPEMIKSLFYIVYCRGEHKSVESYRFKSNNF